MAGLRLSGLTPSAAERRGQPHAEANSLTASSSSGRFLHRTCQQVSEFTMSWPRAPQAKVGIEPCDANVIPCRDAVAMLRQAPFR